MAEYVYSAITPERISIKGKISLNSKQDVIDLLKRKKYSNISVRRNFELNIFANKITDTLLARFTRQLAVMVNSGLPIVQALEILERQNESKRLKETVSACLESVKAGKSLHESLSASEKVFSSLYTGLVRAGESSGSLGEVLNRLADYMERNSVVKRKVKGALIYPAIVIFVAFSAIVILLAFVVPSFSKMFLDMGKELPFITQVIVNISDIVKGNFPVIAGLFIISLIAYKIISSKEKGKLFIGKILLKVPFLGELLKRAAIGRFCSTMGTLLKGGVSMLDALDISAKATGNKVIEKVVIESKKDVSEGKPLFEPLSRSKYFPDMTVQMISVGEKVGELDKMMSKIADFYDTEVTSAVDSLISIIEPVMIVFLGLIIGVVLIAMYMPMFDMMMIME